MKKAKLHALAAILTLSLAAGNLQAGDFDAAPSFFEAVWTRIAAVFGLGEAVPVNGLGEVAPVGGKPVPAGDNTPEETELGEIVIVGG